MDRKYSDPTTWDNSIDADDDPSGGDGGYDAKGNFITPRAMLELIELRAENESLRANLAKAEKDADRLRGLRKLCGYVEDGSNTSIHISQDDATRNWHLSIGPLKPGQKGWYANTFNGVIDAAIAKQKESKE